MSRGVQPNEHAFVRAVLRYASLSHNPGPTSPECRRLAAVLVDESSKGASRRQWLRLAVRIAATVRRNDVQGPATVVDIGAGGLRLADPNGLARTRGARTVVSLRPRQGTRIDVPCEVVHRSDDGTVGLRFCGAPLVLNERRAA